MSNCVNTKKKSSDNVTWFNGHITREHRESLHGHKGAAIWFTGLSASGKSTISYHMEKKLYEMGCTTYVFDGDNVRHGLCGDLGFTEEDRVENIRRIGEMVSLFVDAGMIALTAFISPYRKDRLQVRNIVGHERFIEVFVDCPLEVCMARDPKGIYAKANAGVIENFTGISAPYESPEDPELIIKSHEVGFAEAAEMVIDFMKERSLFFSRRYARRMTDLKV